MRSRSIALLAVMIGLAIAPTALSRFAPTKVYRDAAYKFSLKYFTNWEQVPVEAGQKTVVAKFHDPADKGRQVPTEIEVYRVDLVLKTGDAPVTGNDGKKPTPEEMKALMERFGAPDDAFDAMTRSLIVPPGQKLPNKDKDGKKIESADKFPGLLYTFEINLAGGQEVNPAMAKDVTYFAMMATFKKDNLEYGVKAMCPVRDRKKLENDYKSILRSFKCFDEDAKDVASISALDGVKISPARRDEIERSMIKGWKVIVSPKKNYIVIYNTANGRNHALAKTIAERIEKIREKVYEIQFPPAHAIEAVSIVRVCKDDKEYHSYGGPGGSAGYWSSGTEELVFYDMSKSRKIDDNTLAVLYHEAFHQYIYYSVGNVAPHSWFNEGHGDYYAGTRYAGGAVKVDPFKWRTGTVKNAIRQGAREKKVVKDSLTGKETISWGNQGYTPLQDLVSFTQRDYYSYPGVSYAQGWSLVYFLREIVPKNKAMNAKWGNILKTYFDVLQREVNKTGQVQRGGLGDGPARPLPPDAPDGPDGKGEPSPGDPAPSPGDDADPSGPGEDPDGGGDDPEEPEIDPGFQPEQDGFATPDALRLAVEEAFKGVDWAEFEKAWRDAILKIGG